MIQCSSLHKLSNVTRIEFYIRDFCTSEDAIITSKHKPDVLYTANLFLTGENGRFVFCSCIICTCIELLTDEKLFYICM